MDVKNKSKQANGMNALLIDDNEEMTDLLGTYLKMHGYSCTITNSGKDGLDKILTNNHDVILLDIAMPQFSGLNVISTLEKMGKLREHKIIVLTASSITDEEMAYIQKSGVVACLKKPVELNHLLNVIRSCSEPGN